jgi:uncharacterized membrane protein YccF (DUF307 family)
VYGGIMHPIGWAYAGLVWAFAIVALFIEDAAKVLTVRLTKNIM